MRVIWIDLSLLNEFYSCTVVLRVGGLELFLIKRLPEQRLVSCLKLVVDLARFGHLKTIKLVERLIVGRSFVLERKVACYEILFWADLSYKSNHTYGFLPRFPG